MQILILCVPKGYTKKRNRSNKQGRFGKSNKGGRIGFTANFLQNLTNRKGKSMRKYLKIFTVLFVFLSILLFIFCSHPTSNNNNSKEFKEKQEIMSTYVLKSNENLDFVLKKMDISNLERYKITHALSEYLDMKSCMPGDSIVVIKDTSGKFEKLVYAKSPFLRFIVSKSDTSYCAKKITESPAMAVSRIKGSIESSLYESLVNIGETPELVFKFADIFAWSIDFLTEVQPGDSFKILVEKEFYHNHFIRDGKILAADYKGAIGSYYAFYFKSGNGKEDYYDENGNSLRKQLLKTPLQYRRITSYFSYSRKHPILGYRRPHYGVDFAAPISTPVSCVGDGHVIFAGWKDGYGKLIIVRHPNSFITYYGHLSRIKRGIVRGIAVKQGQVIGFVGSTGLSTGPHLHFGIKKSGRWVNPLKVNLPPAEPVNKKYKNDYIMQMKTLKEALLEN